jgi:glycosyltransferase involved in cell wall biosynthesis
MAHPKTGKVARRKMRLDVGISVAMCTFNGERYLREQLDSIARQTLPPSELIVCDDGSVDSTQEIVADFARSIPFQVRFVRNPKNLGSTKNFEKAIGLCAGEFIALSDQDDVWYPNKLAALSAVFASNPSVGGVFSDGELINEQSQLIGKQLWGVFRFNQMQQRQLIRYPTSLLCKRRIVTGCTLMFRTALRSSLLPVPDLWWHDAWFAWMLVLKSRLLLTPERLVGYRIHSDQQAGIPPIGFLSRCDRSGEAVSRECIRTARQFEELKAFLEKTPDRPSADLLLNIDGAIRHSRARAILGNNFLSRSKYVLSQFRFYRKYSNGMRTMINDLARARRTP